MDGTLGRRVWYNLWDSNLTIQTSYLARLKYVNHNPVKHGLVKDAHDYPWCSLHWFEENAPSSFRKTVESFDASRVNVFDEFEPQPLKGQT